MQRENRTGDDDGDENNDNGNDDCPLADEDDDDRPHAADYDDGDDHRPLDDDDADEGEDDGHPGTDDSDDDVCVDLVSRGKGPFAERPDYRVPQLEVYSRSHSAPIHIPPLPLPIFCNNQLCQK